MKKVNKLKSSILMFLKNNKVFFINFFIMLFILSLFFLIYYPGILPYDGNYQWQQVKTKIINDAHPFFSTYFMYLTTKIHNTLTPFIIFQMTFLSFTWSFFVNLLKTNSKQKVIVIIYTVLMLFIPIISLYSITVWKDVLYTYYLFFCSVIFYQLFIKKDYKLINFILLGLSLAMIFSYRHNGIIVCVMLMFLLIIIFLKNKSKFKKIFLSFAIFVITILIISIPKNYYLKKSKIIEKNNNVINYSAIESYVLWMTGAHLRDNNIKDKDDLKFLNKIIPIEEWKKAYNPFLINGTNLAEHLDKKFVIDNKKELRKIFVKYSFKNPETILIHYIKADSLILNPVSQLKTYVYVYSFSSWEKNNMNFDAITQSKLPKLQNAYNKVINLSFVKILRIFYQPAFLLYIIILMIILLEKKVYGKGIWLFIAPMIANTISLIPINLAQDLRYVYINYLTFFSVLLLLIINKNKIINKKKSK